MVQGRGRGEVGVVGGGGWQLRGPRQGCLARRSCPLRLLLLLGGPGLQHGGRRGGWHERRRHGVGGVALAKALEDGVDVLKCSVDIIPELGACVRRGRHGPRQAAHAQVGPLDLWRYQCIC